MSGLLDTLRTELRDPNFRRLFGARFVSAFGSAMAPIAMAFGILRLTGSATDMGLVIAAQSSAQVAIQLFAGALADRWSRRRMMIFADCLAAAAQASIALLLFSGYAELAPYLCLMAINGVGFALFWPAAVGMVPLVVPQEKLQSANALLSTAQATAMGLGGATAGLLVATVGAGAAIALDATSFCLSAVLVMGLRPGAQRHAAPVGLLRELREGFQEFTRHRWLWVIVLQFSLVIAAWSGGFLIVGPVVAERAMQGAVSWGWVAGALGLGHVCGGLLSLRIHFEYPMRAATLCVLTFSLPLVALIGPAPVSIVAGAAFAAGVGGQVFGVLWNTALHTRVAPEALSRVSAYDVVGSIALAPLGEALAGPMIERVGARPTLVFGALLIILPTLLALCVSDVRNLRARSTDIEPP